MPRNMPFRSVPFRGIMVTLSYSRTTIWKFLREYAMHGSLARKEGSGRPTKITVMVKQLVERQMLHDDETTAYQLHK